MTAATDTDIQQIKDLIATGNSTTQKQIADLAIEMRVGFANVDTKFANVDTKFADIKGDIRELRSDIKALDGKFEEKTKNLDQRLSSGEFISRGIAVGLTVTVVGGLLLIFSKILFFGKLF
jgi:peptidoglycan hydrolase CwlO-like protein